MEDLDYKDLFRDAIHTIAYIARAAGFDPNDPTIEPPAIIARVANQRADLERLTAERTALLAPVEGVDLEEVLRLDREGTAGPWRAIGASIRVALPGGIEYQWATASYPRDTALIAHYRTAAPALAREVARLRADLSTAHAAGSRLAAENERLEDEVRRLRADVHHLHTALCTVE